MHLRIRLYDEPILRQKGKLVTEFDDKLKELTEDMIETMYTDHAAGLAAQQVGQALQLFVLDVLDSAKYLKNDLNVILDGKKIPLDLVSPLVVINPELKPIRCQEITHKEVCMSLPGGIALPITRPEWVHLKYQDVQGVWHELQSGGILARCILHEFDHLQGILIIDRAEKRELMRVESKLKQLKRATRNFLKGEATQHDA